MAEWLDTLSFLNLPVSLKNNVGDVPLLYLQYIMGSDVNVKSCALAN